jgi:hypothetical protein
VITYQDRDDTILVGLQKWQSISEIRYQVFGSADKVQFGATCGVRRWIGLPLDPNVNTHGAMARGALCKSASKRKALSVVA